MKANILIIIDCDNHNVNYVAAVAQAKQQIQVYFGVRNIIKTSSKYPLMSLACEITEDDIKALNAMCENDAITLIPLTNNDLFEI
jgi:hypothetical protein